MSGVLHGVIASLAGRVTDTFWKYVSLLLNTRATNGAQNNTFLDASTNNFTVTRNGDTTQGSFNPYMPNGYWSGYFDGTGDYLTLASNAAFDFGAGDFTIEAWVNIGSATGLKSICAKIRDFGPFIIGVNGTTFVYYVSSTGTTWNIASNVSGGSVSVGVWAHVALVRSGSTFTPYVNGVAGTTTTSAATLVANAENLVVGANFTNVPSYVDNFNGYISNLRLVKGTAVYTANFTPPTTPLTAITNTSLLCLQDNQFKDNSTNNFTITVNGDTRISKFAPFNPPASYSTASYGGSGYFDGTGDYLTAAQNSAFNLSTGAFTVEAWVYLSAYTSGGSTAILSLGNGASGSAPVTYTGWGLLVNTSGNAVWYRYDGTETSYFSSNTIPLNQWTHVVAVRNGSSNFSIYINGSRGYNNTSATVSYNNVDTNPLNIGAWSSGVTLATRYITGYISNARVVAGTAVYDPTQTTLTVPTAPVTAITNTSFLLNFTNAGIYDAATINDGQTVGNAQVSTTQAKFGTTSMAFDGTGDEVSIVAKPELRFGTAPFTVEMWVYCTNAASGATQDLVGNLTNVAGDTNWHFSISSTAVLQAGTYNNVLANSGAATLSSTTWTHVAFTFDGTTYRVFINGTVGTTTSTTVRNLSDSTSAIKVGNTNFGGRLFNGYIDELRITNGVARYTANFTPPTAAFPTL